MQIPFKTGHRTVRNFSPILAAWLILFAAACSHLPEGDEPVLNLKMTREAELAKTEEIIPLMPNDYTKANAYLELAELNEVIGEHVNARRLVRKAGEVLSVIEEENCLQEKLILLETARLELVMGAFGEALKYAKQVKSCEGEPEEGERDRILEKISDHFISEKRFDDALGAAIEIKDVQFKNPLILRVLDGKINSEETEGTDPLAKPEDSTLEISDIVQRAGLLQRLEKGSQTEETLRNASVVIQEIQDPFQKVLKLLLLARAEHRIKGSGSGAGSLEEAGKILQTMEEDSYSEVVLHLGLATTQVRTGDIGGALRTVDSLHWISDQTVGLILLALENTTAHNNLAGDELMRKSLERLEDIRDPFWKGFFHQTVGAGLIKKGELEGARENLQRAKALYGQVRPEDIEGMEREFDILEGQVEALLKAETQAETEETLKSLERGKSFLPLEGAYSDTADAEVLGGLDAVLLFEKEWERVLALSYISRNLMRSGQKEKAYKLARIWDPPIIRFIILSNIAKGASMVGQRDDSNLLKILKFNKSEPEPVP